MVFQISGDYPSTSGSTATVYELLCDEDGQRDSTDISKKFYIDDYNNELEFITYEASQQPVEMQRNEWAFIQEKSKSGAVPGDDRNRQSVPPSSYRQNYPHSNASSSSAVSDMSADYSNLDHDEYCRMLMRSTVDQGVLTEEHIHEASPAHTQLHYSAHVMQFDREICEPTTSSNQIPLMISEGLTIPTQYDVDRASNAATSGGNNSRRSSDLSSDEEEEGEQPRTYSPQIFEGTTRIYHHDADQQLSYSSECLQEKQQSEIQQERRQMPQIPPRSGSIALQSEESFDIHKKTAEEDRSTPTSGADSHRSFENNISFESEAAQQINQLQELDPRSEETKQETSLLTVAPKVTILRRRSFANLHAKSSSTNSDIDEEKKDQQPLEDTLKSLPTTSASEQKQDESVDIPKKAAPPRPELPRKQLTFPQTMEDEDRFYMSGDYQLTYANTTPYGYPIEEEFIVDDVEAIFPKSSMIIDSQVGKSIYFYKTQSSAVQLRPKTSSEILPIKEESQQFFDDDEDVKSPSTETSGADSRASFERFSFERGDFIKPKREFSNENLIAENYREDQQLSREELEHIAFIQRLAEEESTSHQQEQYSSSVYEQQQNILPLTSTSREQTQAQVMDSKTSCFNEDQQLTEEELRHIAHVQKLAEEENIKSESASSQSRSKPPKLADRHVPESKRQQREEYSADYEHSSASSADTTHSFAEISMDRSEFSGKRVSFDEDKSKTSGFHIPQQDSIAAAIADELHRDLRLLSDEEEPATSSGSGANPSISSADIDEQQVADFVTRSEIFDLEFLDLTKVDDDLVADSVSIQPSACPELIEHAVHISSPTYKIESEFVELKNQESPPEELTPKIPMPEIIIRKRISSVTTDRTSSADSDVSMTESFENSSRRFFPIVMEEETSSSRTVEEPVTLDEYNGLKIPIIIKQSASEVENLTRLQSEPIYAEHFDLEQREILGGCGIFLLKN